MNEFSKLVRNLYEHTARWEAPTITHRRYLALACVLAVAVVKPAHANLVSNGSFESPGTGCAAGITTLPGWTVTSGNIDIESAACSGMPAADGTYFLDLTGSHAENGVYDVGTIAQSIATQVGQEYSLSFYFGGNPQWQAFSYPNDSPIKAMNALLNGSVAGTYSVNTAGVSVTNPQWVSENLLFTATSATTQISFQSLNGSLSNPSDFGPLLDGVDVEPVPLPAAAWLMLSGLVGLGVMARRRKIGFV